MNIFITGGTTGIGLSLANAYLQEKNSEHRVGVMGRDLRKIDHFLNSLSPEIKRRLFCYEGDVRDLETLKEHLKNFLGRGEDLHLMVANAGVSMGKKSAVPNFPQAKELFDINVKGVLNAFDVALEYMIPQRHGQLVAISSVASLIGLPGTSAYSASKAAVNKICESFAVDLAPMGIHVTCILPGFVDTPLTRKNRHPMPFIMSSEKAAQLILKAIQQKRTFFTFPFIMHLIFMILGFMPLSWRLGMMKYWGRFIYPPIQKGPSSA